jgi:hypothetical protein
MRKNRIRSWLLVGMLALSLAVTLSPWTAQSTHAQTSSADRPAGSLLGGMDLMGYCRSLGYVSVRTIGTTYDSWRCVSSTGNDVQFSMQAACQWQYHTPNAWDVTDNFYSATGGQCWSGKVLGGINAQGYCRYLGYDGVELRGNTAYGWYCFLYSVFSQTRVYYPIPSNGDQPNMFDACTWMYNTLARGRAADFYTPTSWQCIG